MQRYAEWVSAKLDTGKASGEISSAIDTRAPAIIFIGTIQRLIMQSMNSSDRKLARARLANSPRALRVESNAGTSKHSRRPINSDRGRKI